MPRDEPTLIRLSMVFDIPEGDRLYYTFDFDQVVAAVALGEWMELFAAEGFTNRGGDLAYNVGDTVIYVNPRYVGAMEKVQNAATV